MALVVQKNSTSILLGALIPPISLKLLEPLKLWAGGRLVTVNVSPAPCGVKNNFTRLPAVKLLRVIVSDPLVDGAQEIKLLPIKLTVSPLALVDVDDWNRLLTVTVPVDVDTLMS